MKVILMTVILTSIVAIQVEDAIPAAMRKKLGLNLPVVSLFNEEHGNTTFLQLSGLPSMNPTDVGSGVKKYCTSGCDLPCPVGAHGPGWKLPGGRNDAAAELRFDGVELNKQYFTVSMWVNRDDRNSDIGLFSYGEYPIHQGFMVQMRNSDFHIRASSSVSPGFRSYDSGAVGWTNAMVVGKWVHVAIVKDGNTEIRYYRNGKQVGTPNKNFNGSPNTMPANRHFNVGSWFESNKILKGYVSNIHVTGSAYTDTQILSLYNAESQQGCSGKDAHESIFDLLTDIKESIKNELVSVTKTAGKRCTSNTKAKVAAKKKDFYEDLTGCAKGSECETGTEAQQKLAVDANKDLVVRNAEGAKLDGQLGTLDKQITAAKKAKTGFEKDQTDGDALHKKRMAKFQNAIRSLTYLDTCLDATTGKIACPAKKGTVLLSEEDKNAIGHFKVGKVMLLMLDQALGGVKEKKLVNTLKKLLASCIKSLENSKKLELAAHSKWITYLKAKIGAQKTKLEALIKQKGAIANKILANNKKKAEAELKKKNALAALKKERTSCINLHKNYVASVTDHNDETAAIDEMIKILKEAKLNAKTQKIRAETEKTKHGVQESVNGKN